MAQSLIDAATSDDIMFVLSAGQSLSRGTTLRENFAPLWGEVNSARALMLDFNHEGYSARGWNYAPVDAERFDGFTPMLSAITETPAPAMVAQILSHYDTAGRQGPQIAHAATGALGASILELMTSAEDMFADPDRGLAQTQQGELIVVANGTGAYDYFVHDAGAAVYLDSHRHPPGLWDTMRAQIGFLAEAAAMAERPVHTTAAIGFVHGTADADLDHPDFGYDWALVRYIDMIEAELRAASGLDDLAVVVALSQAQGDADATVPLAQLSAVLSDDRLHLANAQFQYRFSHGSDPGIDNRHLSPEGYVHLGQGLGASLGQALTAVPLPPILISAVQRVAPLTLEVTFSGVQDRLIADTSLFREDQGFNAPEFFGFALFDAASGAQIALHDAWILDAHKVRLETTVAPEGPLRLMLGPHGEDLNPDLAPRAMQSFNTVTLRDAAPLAQMLPPEDYDGDIFDVFRFAPIQSFDLSL